MRGSVGVSAVRPNTSSLGDPDGSQPWRGGLLRLWSNISVKKSSP
jgi:hypothetical protein